MKRIHAIDFCRGLVMIIMALDHSREFLHITSLTQNPTDLATTTPLLFFTRWITHLCAPTFVFLSGTSAWISSRRRPDPGENRRFLLKRGIWLVILEFTLINFALWMDIRFRSLIFEVIGTIGVGFIILSLLYYVSPKMLALVAIVIIFSHDLLNSVMLPSISPLAIAGSMAIRPGVFEISPHFTFIVAYPIIPWLGIMLAGFACGTLFEKDIFLRRKLWLRFGLASIGLFALLRFLNFYGNPSRWTHQHNGLFSFLSFINVNKYPPSLLYTLIMLGILFLLIALSEGKDNRFTRIVMVYGRTPLFYFVIHLYIIHLLLFPMVFLQGFHTGDLVFGAMNYGRPATGSGIGLGGVYLVWIGVVVLMYPLCLLYGRFKATHRQYPWLRYL